MTRSPAKLSVAAAAPVGGRERLLEAGLRLAARSRSITAVGIRELGREAGLNPNTFYRHFGSFEDLYFALIDQIGNTLRQELRALRREAPVGADLAGLTVDHVFEFARRNPEAITVCVRELHGASQRVREGLAALIRGIALDMAEDLRDMQLVPALPDELLREISQTVVQHVLHLTLDYLEHPRRRAELTRQATQFIYMLIAGAGVLGTAGRRA